MGAPGVWNEAAFQEALCKIDPSKRAEIEKLIRDNKQLLLSLATK